MNGIAMLKRPFDCVAMKCRIQAKLVTEERRLSIAERNREVQRRGLADPVLGPWAAKLFILTERGPTIARVAEKATEYGKSRWIKDKTGAEK